jgi:predicted RNA-binding protein associated with RNAse of E/G family
MSIPITVHIHKPGKGQTVTYQGELLRADGGHVLVLARWERPRLDLGYVVFDPGDLFYEHFYTDRWFNIYAIATPEGSLKGWYCNITRPAGFNGAILESEDLELDLFVSPDRQTLLTLDMDEFLARDFATREPETYAAALAALEELRRRAGAGEPPFHSVTPM